LTSDNKGKRKALADDDDREAVVEGASDKKTTAKSTRTRAQKSRTTAKESHPTDMENDDDTEDAAVPKKKKMRKLNVNIFGSAKADSLDWANQFNLVSLHRYWVYPQLTAVYADATFQGGGGLDIPTELSPVKVPARSMARTSVSAIPFRKG